MSNMKYGGCGKEKVVQKHYSYLIIFLLVAIVFWFNLLSNEQSGNYNVVLGSASISQKRRASNVINDKIIDNPNSEQEEVISYMISSDHELNKEGKVENFNGAMDFFSGFFYHQDACQRISGVAQNNGPSIAVSAIQQQHQTRLGNQLSNFASGYAIWRDFGILNYLDPEQLHIIGKAFKLPTYDEKDNNATYYKWVKGNLFNLTLLKTYK